MQYLFGILLFLVSLFLILLVLVQRGRGGGLTGALGGMGGQSAFGARAGDTFTYVTIWAAAAWILLCIAATKFMGTPEGPLGRAAPLGPAAVGAPATNGDSSNEAVPAVGFGEGLGGLDPINQPPSSDNQPPSTDGETGNEGLAPDPANESPTPDP